MNSFLMKNRGIRAQRKSSYWNGKRAKFALHIAMACVMLQILFLSDMSYFYGSLSHSAVNVHHFHLLLVDYDGGIVGKALKEAAQQLQGDAFPTLDTVSPQEYGSISDLRNTVCHSHHLWGAVFTHSGASDRLSAALAGGASATNYNSSDAITFIWNAIRYPAWSESLIQSNMELLIEATIPAYAAINGSYAYSHLNTSDPAALQAVSAPFNSSSNINIMPTPQGSRVLYNTVTTVMNILPQFFFVMALNGIHNSFEMFTKLRLHHNIRIRLISSCIYSGIMAITISGYIWAFRKSWPVSGVQWALTWLSLWFIGHIHFLIIDTAAGFIPETFISFFMITYVLVSVTSTLTPFELAPGFYKWQYAIPAWNWYQLVNTIWSGGCDAQFAVNLPVLFAWWLVGIGGSVLSMIKKCNNATQYEKIEEGQEELLKQCGELGTISEAAAEGRLKRHEHFPDSLRFSSRMPFEEVLGLKPVRTAPASIV